MTLQKLILFANDAGALEKLLRLLQSISQILAAIALNPENVTRWLHLRRQFALGRRYFRFFRFLDCFSRAWGAFFDASSSSIGVPAALQTGKWMFLGAYLGLESATILDACGAWPWPGAAAWMIEANKFWFYSLVFSVLWGVMQLSSSSRGDLSSIGMGIVPPRPPAVAKHLTGGMLVVVGGGGTTSKKSKIRSSQDDDEEKLRAAAAVKDEDDRHRVKRRLVADCFDLLIPGFVTGWIPTSPVIVGFASIVSTLLSSRDIWDRLDVRV